MISLLTGVKKWAWIIGAAVLGILYAITRIKWLEYSVEKAKYRAEHAEAQLDWNRDVEEADIEIEADTDARTQKLAEQIEAGETVDILAHPNDY